MKKYLITYDLNKPGKDYSSLYNSIKSLGPWWHYLDSTWIIKSEMSANDISRRLVPSIDSADRLLVVKIDEADSQGWLTPDAWKWINS